MGKTRYLSESADGMRSWRQLAVKDEEEMKTELDRGNNNSNSNSIRAD